MCCSVSSNKTPANVAVAAQANAAQTAGPQTINMDDAVVSVSSRHTVLGSGREEASIRAVSNKGAGYESSISQSREVNDQEGPESASPSKIISRAKALFSRSQRKPSDSKEGVIYMPEQMRLGSAKDSKSTLDKAGSFSHSLASRMSLSGNNAVSEEEASAEPSMVAHNAEKRPETAYRADRVSVTNGHPLGDLRGTEPSSAVQVTAPKSLPPVGSMPGLSAPKIPNKVSHR